MSELRRLRRAGGSALKLLVELLPQDWDPRSGEEDTCVVFADLSGYSSHVAIAGDDAALAVLAVLDEHVDAALAGRRGIRVVKRLGDGLMLVARDSRTALDTMLTMVNTFDADAAAAHWPVRLRAGAHRGATRRQGDDYFGYNVNLAARITQSAGGGQVLTTARVLAGVDLPALSLTARPAGELTAKGVTGAVDLFTVERLAQPAAGWRQLAG